MKYFLSFVQLLSVIQYLCGMASFDDTNANNLVASESISLV